jgi:hypothetical protein
MAGNKNTYEFSFTLWRRVLQKLLVVQPVKKFPPLYGIQWFHVAVVVVVVAATTVAVSL